MGTERGGGRRQRSEAVDHRCNPYLADTAFRPTVALLSVQPQPRWIKGCSAAPLRYALCRTTLISSHVYGATSLAAGQEERKTNPTKYSTLNCLLILLSLGSLGLGGLRGRGGGGGLGLRRGRSSGRRLDSRSRRGSSLRLSLRLSSRLSRSSSLGLSGRLGSRLSRSSSGCINSRRRDGSSRGGGGSLRLSGDLGLRRLRRRDGRGRSGRSRSGCGCRRRSGGRGRSRSRRGGRRRRNVRRDARGKVVVRRGPVRVRGLAAGDGQVTRQDLNLAMAVLDLVLQSLDVVDGLGEDLPLVC